MGTIRRERQSKIRVSAGLILPAVATLFLSAVTAPREAVSLPNPEKALHAKEITPAERSWWSFKIPVRRPVSDLRDPRWSENPIDAFLMKKFQEKGLQPAPQADKRTLIRRANLDLVGLLPEPREVTAFVDDNSANALEKLIDRLLDSPHYGERWGRHWLDVVRYGDSGGYEHDRDYPNAWRYRDYVIRAFNEDKPYDQFILEQLAGDELEEVSYDSLTATGFHRVGATVGFREKDNPHYRYIYLNDMIATTSRAFMALSVECARCHDHKFDPIRQLDYYRMMAIFFPFVKYDHPLAPPDQVAAYEARKAEIDGRVKPLEESIREIQKPYRKLAFEKKLATFPEEIQIAVHTPETERTPGQKLLAAQVLTIGGRGTVKKLLGCDRVRRGKVENRITAGPKHRTLVRRRQKSAAPVRRAAERAATVIVDDHEAG